MELQFRKAFDILLRTLPFVAIRLLAYGVAFFLGAGWIFLMILLTRDWPFPGEPWMGWVVGAFLFGTGAKLIRNYLLYLVKAAHVSVITRLALEGEMPPGQDQFGFAWRTIRTHVMQISVLFAVDQLIRVVLKAFHKVAAKSVGAIPGAGSLGRFAKTVLDYTIGYVDEAILSYSLLHPRRNPWETGREGLILYAQNWRTILGSGLILALMSYGVVALVAVPGMLISYLTTGAANPMGIGISLAVGFFVKFVFMDPFALTAVIVNYHAAIANQRPDPSWESKLSEISGKFGQFAKQAREWVSPGGQATPPPPPPAGGPVNI